MNQARDEKAEEYIRSADPNEIADMPVTTCEYAFKDGWDAALEFLRGKESPSQFFSEQLKHYQDGLKNLHKDGENDGYARMNLIAADFWEFIQEVSCLSEANAALKERIRELENG